MYDYRTSTLLKLLFDNINVDIELTYVKIKTKEMASKMIICEARINYLIPHIVEQL